jgi:uncharacterized membrane protein YfcA
VLRAEPYIQEPFLVQAGDTLILSRENNHLMRLLNAHERFKGAATLFVKEVEDPRPSELLRGGMLSGFFGGLSGHQGALRSAFLIKCGLSKESFIATGVVIACLVDITRISVYASHFSLASAGNNVLLFAAILSAFLGAFIGNRLMKKVTLRTIQVLVAIMLLGIALALLLGM